MWPLAECSYVVLGSFASSALGMRRHAKENRFSLLYKPVHRKHKVFISLGKIHALVLQILLVSLSLAGARCEALGGTVHAGLKITLGLRQDDQRREDGE
jgi:hypothetical protein